MGVSSLAAQAVCPAAGLCYFTDGPVPRVDAERRLQRAPNLLCHVQTPRCALPCAHHALRPRGEHRHHPLSLTTRSLRPAQLPRPTAPGPRPLLRKRNAGTGSNLYFPGLCQVGQTDSGCVGAACQMLAASFWLCLLSVCGSVIGAAGLYQVLQDTLLNAGWLCLCFHNSSSRLSETRTLGSALQQPVELPSCSSTPLPGSKLVPARWAVVTLSKLLSPSAPGPFAWGDGSGAVGNVLLS